MNRQPPKLRTAEEQLRVCRYAVEQVTFKGARVENAAAALDGVWWVKKHDLKGWSSHRSQGSSTVLPPRLLLSMRLWTRPMATGTGSKKETVD